MHAISIKDIKLILNGNDDILSNIYQQKLREKKLFDEELQAFRDFLNSGDSTETDSYFEYQTVENAIDSLLPGEWGSYFKNHFSPFLNIKVITQEQKQAMENLLS